MVFNQHSRKSNIIKSSFFSLLCRLINIALGLGYRFVFLKILSIEYLGINGLFTNVIGVLSLVELGITYSIVYRFYDPISKEDVNRVGELMNFFRQAYLVIALTITVIGLSITPFIQSLIKDASDIPPDVNIHVIFILFLLQSSSSYLFSYKLTLLTADQKQYLHSVITTGIAIASNTIQIVVLIVFRDYTIALLSGIATTILLNWISSLWVTGQYRPVFLVKSKLSKQDRHVIFKDSSAAMLHKVGGTVLTSTDSILLSRFFGLAATGLYANYALIISSVMDTVQMVFSGFTPSLGNAHVVLDKDSRYEMYRKSLYLNFLVVGVTTVCIFGLIDDFLFIWLRKEYFLDNGIVILLTAYYFINGARVITTSYTNACGLFVRDKIRPIIEASLNILISIVSLKAIGLGGVFLGTIISSLLTVFWREPLLLYKYAFEKSVAEYWKEYLRITVVVLISASIVHFFINGLFNVDGNIFLWLLKALACIAVFLLVHFIFYFRTKEYRYMIDQAKEMLVRRKDQER